MEPIVSTTSLTNAVENLISLSLHIFDLVLQVPQLVLILLPDVLKLPLTLLQLFYHLLFDGYLAGQFCQVFLKVVRVYAENRPITDWLQIDYNGMQLFNSPITSLNRITRSKVHDNTTPNNEELGMGY